MSSVGGEQAGSIWAMLAVGAESTSSYDLMVSYTPWRPQSAHP